MEATPWPVLARKTTEHILEGRNVLFRVLRKSLGLQLILQILRLLLVQTHHLVHLLPHGAQLEGRRHEPRFPRRMAWTDGHLWEEGPGCLQRAMEKAMSVLTLGNGKLFSPMLRAAKHSHPIPGEELVQYQLQYHIWL